MGVRLLDPAAAFFVSLFILRVGWLMGAGAVRDLVDARGEPRARVVAEARAVPGVAAVQRVRTRRMGPDVLVDLEIGVDGRRSLRNAHAVADAVRVRVVEGLAEVADVMVHVNPVEAAGRPAPGDRAGADPAGPESEATGQGDGATAPARRQAPALRRGG